jgi:hypothetical protein
MPDLKRIIKEVKPEDNNKINVRALTIETIGYFLGAIQENTHLFNNEYPNIMKSLINLSK